MKIEIKCPDCGKTHTYDIGVIIETCTIKTHDGELVEKTTLELVNVELVE